MDFTLSLSRGNKLPSFLSNIIASCAVFLAKARCSLLSITELGIWLYGTSSGGSYKPNLKRVSKILRTALSIAASEIFPL